MPDIYFIASQVKHNCNISDARYGGLYSPCGLLLRLRDLYRIEERLKPWKKIEPDKIGGWIDERERTWADVNKLNFRKIVIDSREYHPFDVKGINTVLENEGLLYGAGYGNLSKPVFFLAELLSKNIKSIYSIYVTGKEIARDLSAAPAMLQGNTIIAREETTTLFLWGKLEEMTSRKHEGVLSRAFSEYGISRVRKPAGIESWLVKIVREELSAYIYHELGEASQRRALGRWWKDLIVKLPYSRAELFIRGLKDILSDTCSA